MCDQKCTGPTNAWLVRCLSWKTISVRWFGTGYWHSGRADNNNKTASNAKYSNCKMVNHETYDVSLQNLRSRPFWILPPLRILFLSMIRFVHKVHTDVEFQLTHRLYAFFLRDNLKKLRHFNVFVRSVCKLLLCLCFLLFIRCRLAKKKKNKKKQKKTTTTKKKKNNKKNKKKKKQKKKQDQIETKTKTHKRSKIFRKNPEAVKWISGKRTIVYYLCTCHRLTLVLGIRKARPRLSGPAK